MGVNLKKRPKHQLDRTPRPLLAGWHHTRETTNQQNPNNSAAVWCTFARGTPQLYIVWPNVASTQKRSGASFSFINANGLQPKKKTIIGDYIGYIQFSSNVFEVMRKFIEEHI